ncbi:rRNA pseudouridine synthase [Candidatus Gracilibacteria bacterium]|nr:rRNA pseudouridine synthase [Candidatus Gracilibacteria bacterium]
MSEEKKIRLQKYMSEKGIASRRKSEEFIAKGAVKVNGKVITEMGTKINPDIDKVEVDGKFLKNEEEKKVYYIFNKPAGVVTTTHRTEHEPDIITDYFPKDVKLFPIGRLDKETTGLIIMTNDGDLTYKLSHPSFGHEKEYHVLTTRKIYDDQLEELQNEAMQFLGRKLQKPVKIYRRSARSFGMVIKEGMNRQIRRMVGNLGLRVEKLQRVRINNIQLGDLEVGKWKKIKLSDIDF